MASGLAPAKAPNPSDGPLRTDLDGVGTALLDAAAEADSCLPPIEEPRSLGWMPPNPREAGVGEAEAVFALKAAKLFLLELAPDEPDEVGTALKGDALELKEENVGCVRAGSGGGDVDASGFDDAAAAAVVEDGNGGGDEDAASTLATLVAGSSAFAT